MIMAFSTQILMVPLAAALVIPRPGGGPRLGRERTSARSGLVAATFAGGCFWSMERPFDQLDGVIAVTVGYMGGHTTHPTYEQVAAGRTGHAESVQIVYDSAKVTYEQLLDVFWHHIDPLTVDGQVCDFGSQYRTVIFYHSPTQHRLAAASKRRLEASGRFGQPIATQVLAAGEFYPAEDYHQHFYRKNPTRYEAYRLACGRDRRLKELWGATVPTAESHR
jgi:peptide-methionine (S)-S-oxide reductase